jgi:uncharacterized linocin/CFP29 family protein
MADSNTQLHWTDEQWNKVRQVVYEEARKARVAGNILPLYGPLEPNTDFVPQQTIAQQDIQVAGAPALALFVQDTQPLQLSTPQVEVMLRGAQIADPDLTSALIAFRRAASVVARLEDAIILTGQLGPAQGAPGPRYVAAYNAAVLAILGRGGAPAARAPAVAAAAVAAARAAVGPAAPPGADAAAAAVGAAVAHAAAQALPAPIPFPVGLPPLWQVRGGQAAEGVLFSAALAERVRWPPAAGVAAGPAVPRSLGEALVTAISGAIGQLEQAFHLGPFACVLDQAFFTAVQTPDASLVLPQDRIMPFLGGGALMRSSVLPHSTALVIALGGEPIDLVVATDISVCFLQVTTDPHFVFRVYEKIVPRVKQPGAIVVLR